MPGLTAIPAQIANMGDLAQFPVRVMGNKAPDSFFGNQAVLFQGATGLVATTYGIQGVTIGRLRTGVYGVRHPPVEDIGVWPSIQAPSGLGFQVAVKGLSGAAQVVGRSGFFEVHITRNEMAPVVTGTNPSTMVLHQTPPTGTKLDLLIYAGPRSIVGF